MTVFLVQTRKLNVFLWALIKQLIMIMSVQSIQQTNNVNIYINTLLIMEKQPKTKQQFH